MKPIRLEVNNKKFVIDTKPNDSFLIYREANHYTPSFHERDIYNGTILSVYAIQELKDHIEDYKIALKKARKLKAFL